MELLDLRTFAGGALQEKAEEAMRLVLDNMQDPNTPWKAKRHITIRIGFTQNEERDDMAVVLSVEPKLAPVSPVKTRMSVGRDLKNGELYAEEYGRQIRGQMSLEDVPDGSRQETEGETKILDLRKAAL